MSLGQNETFESALETELLEVGLPTDPRQIVGRLYRFGCEHGSHHHILVGTVQAIEVSDEGGLNLYVSNPRFWGMRLISIEYGDGTWYAYVDREGELSLKIRFFEGEFQLL